MRPVLVLLVVLLTAGCSADADPEPPPTSPQASPSPSGTSSAADSAPQGRWRVVVISDSPYYPGGSSQQELTIRVVCDDDCVGTIETESGVVRTVHWDGARLLVELPTHESGAAQCFDAQGSPGPGSSSMTVDRAGELVLEASDPDADGRPTHLAGAYDEEVRWTSRATTAGSRPRSGAPGRGT